MSFQVILDKLMRSVPGAVGAVFADHEGEAVDQISTVEDPYHIRFLGAHNGILLNTAKQLTDSAGAGELKTFFWKTEKLGCYAAPIYDGYFVVLAVDGETPSFGANYALGLAVREIRDEMGF